jgi:hypothetical protein
LTLFELEPGKVLRREIWVLGNYDDFEIESVSSQKGKLKLADMQKVRGPASNWMGVMTDDRIVTRYQLKIDITPPEGAVDTVFTDILEIKIKGGETIPLDCRGFYKGS